MCDCVKLCVSDCANCENCPFLLWNCAFCVLGSMANTLKKEEREQEEKPRNVKRKEELPPLEMVVITNMELFHLDVCWSPKRQQDFKMADLFGSLH